MFSFVETKLFTRLFDEMFSDDAELSKLQDFLGKNPEVGDIILETAVDRFFPRAMPHRC